MNDQIDVFVTATLPEGFAYIPRNFNMEFTGDTASDWDNEIELRMFNHIPGQPLGTSEQYMGVLGLMTPASGNPSRALRGDSYILHSFTSPMWATHTGSITFRLHLTNVAAAVAAAGFLITHIEFLEFDLTQAQRYYINTPIPVMLR